MVGFLMNGKKVGKGLELVGPTGTSLKRMADS